MMQVHTSLTRMTQSSTLFQSLSLEKEHDLAALRSENLAFNPLHLCALI